MGITPNAPTRTKYNIYINEVKNRRDIVPCKTLIFVEDEYRLMLLLMTNMLLWKESMCVGRRIACHKRQALLWGRIWIYVAVKNEYVFKKDEYVPLKAKYVLSKIDICHGRLIYVMRDECVP